MVLSPRRNRKLNIHPLKKIQESYNYFCDKKDTLIAFVPKDFLLL